KSGRNGTPELESERPPGIMQPDRGLLMRIFPPQWFAIGWLVSGGLVVAQEAPPKPAAEPEGVRASQVTVEVFQSNVETRFRASVLAKSPSDRTLRVLTAAHCLSRDDVGRPVRVLRGRASLKGKVVDIRRNPSYATDPNIETPGADNAVALFQ